MIFNLILLMFLNNNINTTEYLQWSEEPRIKGRYWQQIEEYVFANENIVKPLAEKFKYKSVYKMIDFLSKNFKYKDDGAIDYPQYPIETLYLRTGDCEDYSILMAAMLYYLGHDVYLVDWGPHVQIAYGTGRLKFVEPRHGIGISAEYENKEPKCISKIGEKYKCIEYKTW